MQHSSKSGESASAVAVDWKALPWTSLAVIATLLVALYGEIVRDMALVWWTDDAYSHGMLIPPLAVYIAWMSRDEILAVAAEPSRVGYLVTAVGGLVLLVGRLGAEFFLTRVSLVVITAGLVLTYWGWRRLRLLSFALILLATMVPIPAIVYNRLAAPLQLFSSAVASSTLELMSIPVYRDGNVMHLPEISLGVAEACSGLRSVSSLSVLALVAGYLVCKTLPFRLALFLLAFPVAIAINVVRITLTAVLAKQDPALAEGIFHSFSGWVVFLVGFAILYALAIVLERVERLSRPASEPQSD